MQIFYNIDMLNVAISQCLCAEAQLVRYNVKKELVPVENLTFSPYFTVWANDNYYVICRDSKNDEIVHYRIDKLKNVTVTEQEAVPADYGFSPAEYTNKMIYLNGEEERLHEIICPVESVDELIEFFGTDITLSDNKDGTVHAKIRATQGKIKKWGNMVNFEK